MKTRRTRDMAWLVALVVGVAAIAFLFRSPRPSETPTVSTPVPSMSAIASQAPDLKWLRQPDRQAVVLQTRHGKIVFELYPNAAPHHVARIKDLVQKGYYDGILFHRVIPDFMIQFGDPNTRNPDRRLWGLGTHDVPTLAAEFNSLPHVLGTVSMARTQDPDTATTQFFICVGRPSPFLDKKYTVFGQVVQGQEFAETISRVPKNSADVPNTNEPVQKSYLIPHP